MDDPLIDVSKLSYTYPTRETPSLVDVDLSVRPGELVLLSGPTGCGKSTLLRTMNGIIPHDSGGTLSGDVRVLGRETRDADLVWLSSHVGLVFQSPEDQLFSSRLEDEVAFGLENLRLDPEVMVRRVRWALDEVGLSGAVDTPVAELSGGQKQRLAVASVVAMQPGVLLLDEPLSQLDPAGAEQVLEVLTRLRRPASPDAETPPADAATDAEPLVVLNAVSVRYTRRGRDVLHDVDLRVVPGDIVAVMGENGSGKSTLLYTLLGSLRPSSGTGMVLGRDVRRRRRLSGEVGMLFQTPELMLLADTVAEEVTAGPTNLGLSAADVRLRAEEVMRALGIDDLADEPPLALSRGQRLRVALASVLSMRPRLLLLDEPTTGQDRDQIASMMDHLTTTLADGALVFCTHDVLTAARYATRVVVIAAGRVLASAPPGVVFTDDGVMHAAGLHAPAAVEIGRRLGVPGVVSVDDLVRRLTRAHRQAQGPERRRGGGRG